MATTTPFNGTYYRLWAFINGTWTEIAKGIDNSFETSRTAIDISNKTDGKFAAFMPGRISATASGSFILTNESNVSSYVSWGDLWSYYLEGTTLSLQMGTNITGDNEVAFSAFITSLSLTASDDDKVTFDASFQITGTFSSGSA